MIPNNHKRGVTEESRSAGLLELVKETINIMNQMQHVVIMDDRDIEQRDVLGPFDTAAEAEEYAARLDVFVQSSGSMHAVYVSVEPLMLPPDDPSDLIELPDEDEIPDPPNAPWSESPMTTWKAGDPRFTRGPVEPESAPEDACSDPRPDGHTGSHVAPGSVREPYFGPLSALLPSDVSVSTFHGDLEAS